MKELLAMRGSLRQIRAKLRRTRKTARTISWDDVRSAIRASKNAKTRVRVYSPDGFVPNSYKWRCDIQYCEVRRVDGKLEVITGWSSAKRTHAAGNLFVVM
jgi:hypothetical protein